MDTDAQRLFQRKIASYKGSGRSVIYVDESGFARDMPRPHGYAPKGVRCYGLKDWNAKGRTNAIGALTRGALISICLCQGNVDSDVFHKGADTRKLIETEDHKLEHLPPYSPDLNPIEHTWAQAKAIGRREICSIEKIFQIESRLFE